MTTGLPVLGDGSRFEIQRRIGAGSNGIVYEAYDRHRHSIVAVKTLKQITPQSLLHFKGEFRSLARFDKHRNLIQLHELLYLNEQWLITMELVDGVDFLKWVRPTSLTEDPAASRVASTVSATNEPAATRAHSEEPEATLSSFDRSAGVVDPQRLRSALRQLCEGVVTLHRAGKVHRDLKPANVLVTRDGRVVILDFGLVADVALAGAGGEFAGTLAFMAPEQLTGRALPASDWYAVGVMLCQALTGKLPFHGSTSEIAMQKNSHGIGESVGLSEALPEDLARLSQGLMSAQPSLRPTATHILAAAGVSDRTPSTLTPSLVGRERDLSRLREYLDAVRMGKTVIARIQGVSGVGKTALTRAFIEWTMRFRDTLTLQGRCHERESVPFKALDSVVDDLVRFLMRLPDAEVDAVLPRDPKLASRLFPVLDLVPVIAHALRREPEDSDSVQRRRAGLAALRELLGRIANRRTLVIHIDDAHWGDLDSANALCEILRQPDAPPLMLLLSGRTDRNVFMEVLEAENPSLAGVQIETIQLRELERDAAINLASQLLPAGEGIGPERIAVEANGNPFLIGELAREVQFQGVDAAFSFETLVAKRLTQLSAEARRVLEISALAGQPLPVEAARQAADVERLDTAVLYELEHLHLARMTEFEGAPAIDCYHDRVRQALLATLPPDRARVNHGELARALEATGAPDEALALHFQAAGEVERAIEHALKAADHALGLLAFESAVRLYRVVLSLLAPGDRERSKQALMKLGDALAYAGASYEAAQTYLKADQLCTGDEQLEVRRRALHQLLTTAHFDEAMTVAEKLLGLIGLKLPASRMTTILMLARYRVKLRFRGLTPASRQASAASDSALLRIDTCFSLALGLAMVDTLRGAVFQTHHTLMALQTGDPFRTARALAMEAGYRSIRGRNTQPDVNRLLDRSRRLAVESRQPYAEALCSLVEGVTASEWCEWRRALALCDEAVRAFRICSGTHWERTTGHVFSLFSLYCLGDWGEYRRRSVTLGEDAAHREDLYAQTMVSLFAYARLLADDDPAAAEVEHLERISRWQNPTFDIQQFWLTYGLCEIDLYRGHAASANERITRMWPRLRQSLLLRVEVLNTFAQYLRARCAIATAANGDRNALKIARRCARILSRRDLAWTSACADIIQAGIDGIDGDLNQVQARLESARVKLAVAVMPPWLSAVVHLQSVVAPSSTASDAEWFSVQGVRNPGRLAALLVPGIATVRDRSTASGQCKR